MLAFLRIEAACLCRGYVFPDNAKSGSADMTENPHRCWIFNNILRPFIDAPTSLLLRNYDANITGYTLDHTARHVIPCHEHMWISGPGPFFDDGGIDLERQLRSL